MRKIRLLIEDLIIVLESMAGNGTEEVIIFEHESGNPAICDAENPDEIISFTAIDPNDMDMDDNLH